MAAPRAYDEVRVRAIAAKPPHRRTGAEDAALRAARDAGFEESDHPRDEGGKFSSGSGSAAKATAGEKAQVAKVASKDPAKRTPEEKALLAKHMSASETPKKPKFTPFKRPDPYDPAKEGPHDIVGYLSQGYGPGNR